MMRRPASASTLIRGTAGSHCRGPEVYGEVFPRMASISWAPDCLDPTVTKAQHVREAPVCHRPCQEYGHGARAEYGHARAEYGWASQGQLWARQGRVRAADVLEGVDLPQ